MAFLMLPLWSLHWQFSFFLTQVIEEHQDRQEPKEIMEREDCVDRQVCPGRTLYLSCTELIITQFPSQQLLNSYVVKMTVNLFFFSKWNENEPKAKRTPYFFHNILKTAHRHNFLKPQDKWKNVFCVFVSFEYFYKFEILHALCPKNEQVRCTEWWHQC